MLKMWISLSRQQSSGRGPVMPSVAHSSIPPPGPPARPERRKANEKKKTGKEKQKEPSTPRDEATTYHATAPQLPDEINENHGPSSLGAMTALGSPGHHSHERFSRKSEGGPRNRNGPSRKSFRLAGHIPDLSTERNMLPLWLEEETCEGVRQSERHFTNNRNEIVVNDISFESRWDSMRGRNMKRPSIPTVRPPGWENVGQQGKRKKEKTFKTKSNFCPSFTINDIPKDSPLQQTSMDIQPLSPPVRVTIEPPPAPPTINQSSQSDAFDMSELSANVDHMFADSFLQKQQRNSLSTSNLAPQSASNSPARTPSQTSTSAIADRHLWASSDSFICEDFSFCREKPPDRIQQEHIPSQSPPRSYSQVLLSHIEDNRNEFTDHDGMYYADTEVHLHEGFPYEDVLEQENFEADGINFDSIQLDSTNGNETCMAASCQPYPEDLVDRNYDISDDVALHENTVHLDSSNPTMRVTDNLSRQKWIRFDNGSFENMDEIPNGAIDNNIGNSFPQDDYSFDFVHQSNFNVHRKNSLETTMSPTSPTSPVLPRNNSGSTLNLVEPRLEQTPQTYKGQFVRSYSIRGRRASKRVTRTVSQRMKSSEYGKLTEPVPPMFSKAALTMVTGPGLFERGDSPIGEMVSSEASVQIKGQNELQHVSSPPDTGLSKSYARKQSALSPGLPIRAGSLRVPRLPTIFVKRSVSLSAPKVGRGDVPFQRLPERRGSFRQAISGIGAIARSFRRRSGSIQNSTSDSSHIAEKVSDGGPPLRLHRSGSIGSSFSRQIPKAPRLPRRAISHKQTTSNET